MANTHSQTGAAQQAEDTTQNSLPDSSVIADPTHPATDSSVASVSAQDDHIQDNCLHHIVNVVLNFSEDSTFCHTMAQNFLSVRDLMAT